MRRAIALGRRGMKAGHGGPFGAVVVRRGAIVGEGWNRVVTTNDPTAHGEIVAIRAACRRLARFHLSGCDLYTSSEPCPMCLSAIYWAHIDRIFFGCTVNDVVVAICAGAVRRWLIEHDELPDDPLVAQIPVSVRREEEQATYGNRILLLGAPFLHVAFGFPDDRVLPKDVSSHQVNQELRQLFPSNEAFPVWVVADHIGAPTSPSRSADIDRYASALSAVKGVSRVDAFTGSYAGGARIFRLDSLAARFATNDATYFNVVPSVEPFSTQGEDVVHTIRDLPRPFAVDVGGRTAALVDNKSAAFGRMPLAGGIIVVVTFVVLFMLFGSVVVPAKALVLNLLSLTATFGAMVWIFQDGHLSGLLDFTATGTIDLSTPILMFCVAFGLSMDYEIFLLSRVKEEYDRTGDNVSSIALGLEKTGRIVTAAALLLAAVFLAFATSGVAFIKLFGVGLASAVLLDALVVRSVLVPALMLAIGPANWRLPRILERRLPRLNVEGKTAQATEAV